jgi:hypothetical protein
VIENSWVFPAMEALHVVGLALLVGTIVLGDMRVLGWTNAIVPKRTIAAGLWIMAVTGATMFLSNVQRYTENPAFLMKMAVLAALVGLHFLRGTRTTAFLSLVLWTFAVIAARAVIDFDA